MKANCVNQESLWFAIILLMKKERDSCLLELYSSFHACLYLFYGASSSGYH